MSTVLLLEDDEGFSFTLQEALRLAGHKVVAVSKCEDAIAALKRQVPDVMVLDLMIGLDMSMNVASYAAYAAPEAEIIFVTGSTLFPSGELFEMVDNARWILRKPVKVADFTRLIDHAVSAGLPATPIHSYA